MTRPAPASSEPAPLAPFTSLALLPWELAQATHAANVEFWHSWARLFLSSAFPPHPHESRYQLEIPDPIAATGEDLFA